MAYLLLMFNDVCGKNVLKLEACVVICLLLRCVLTSVYFFGTPMFIVRVGFIWDT